MIYLILGKAGHGKDTVAEIIQAELGDRTAITSYAGYLKWLYSHYFGWDGKEKTNRVRTDLQVIGTNIIRETYSEDFWVDRVIEQIQIFTGQFDNFIIADARFKNEVDKMRFAFGDENVYTIRVERPNFESPLTEEQQQHRSEIELDDYVVNCTITNVTLAQLKRDVKLAIEQSQGGM